MQNLHFVPSRTRKKWFPFHSVNWLHNAVHMRCERTQVRISAWAVVFITTATAIYSLGHGLHTLTAVLQFISVECTRAFAFERSWWWIHFLLLEKHCTSQIQIHSHGSPTRFFTFLYGGSVIFLSILCPEGTTQQYIPSPLDSCCTHSHINL